MDFSQTPQRIIKDGLDIHSGAVIKSPQRSSAQAPRRRAIAMKSIHGNASIMCMMMRSRGGSSPRRSGA
ncbi:hypothetical protein [Synergistes jonesii]|uniref:hypothetical protein n=1 Tax=Synergistes jonesii TaxID=2754 RepID=UPI00248F063B|nr:hypothetical protein [Synergistes jonesii]